MPCVFIRKGKCHPSSLSFPQPKMASRRRDKGMTPLAPFWESSLVFYFGSICSLQYMFLSISPGGLQRQKGCYPDLSLFKQLTANCKRTHMGCLTWGRLEYLIRHNWCMTLHYVNASLFLLTRKTMQWLEFNFVRRSLIWIPHENLSALQLFQSSHVHFITEILSLSQETLSAFHVGSGDV